MTQPMPAAPAAAAPQQQPTIDQARLKLRHDIEAEKGKLAKLVNPSPEQLKQIIINTVLSVVGDVVELDVFDHRHQLGIAGDLDRRVSAVEDLAYEGDDDGVPDELARKIFECCSHSLVLAEERLKTESDAEARAALEAHIAACNELTAEFALEPDDGDEGDESDETAEG